MTVHSVSSPSKRQGWGCWNRTSLSQGSGPSFYPTAEPGRLVLEVWRTLWLPSLPDLGNGPLKVSLI